MHNLLHQFDLYIDRNQLFGHADKIILAVSGGVDSMVMAHLFYKSGCHFSIAHCNFSLRGSDSDNDALLVKETAAKYKVDFFSKKFDAAKFAESNKISIQMAARELRFAWFAELKEREGYAYIALAHHMNDVAETLLINLLRSTGIAGLHGIKNKSGIYIRPLLFAGRNEIESYAKKYNILYREDASNAEDKYIRNKIRLKIIPELQKINPSIISGLYNTAAQLQETEALYKEYINILRKELISEKGHGFKLDIKKLKKHTGIRSILFEILSPYGFNSSQVDDIFCSIDGVSGKMFCSAAYRIVKDRDYFLIEPISFNYKEDILVFENSTLIETPFSKLLLHVFDTSDAFEAKTKLPYLAFFDYDKLKFPLVLRAWKKGDSIVPFGMKSRKKISDILIDYKLNLFEKEKAYVLISGTDIIWLIGIRANELHKITAHTKKILQIQVLSK